MSPLLGIYEGFVLHLYIPLLVQDNADHDEKMVKFSIIAINYVGLKAHVPKQQSLLLGVQSILGILLHL